MALHLGMDPIISGLSSINSAAGISFAESLGTSSPAESCEGWVGATWIALGWLKLPGCRWEWLLVLGVCGRHLGVFPSGSGNIQLWNRPT